MEITTSRGNASSALPFAVRDRPLGLLLIVCGCVGVFASAGLTVEYIHFLKAPQERLLCDISPFVLCGPAMGSPASSAFGFPNVILGLVSFTITVATGVLTLASVRLPKWWWIGMLFGCFVAAGLITYLQWYSAFVLQKLCIWCIVIWIITVPIVSFVLGKNFLRLASWVWTIMIVWYLIILGIILSGMWNVF